MSYRSSSTRVTTITNLCIVTCSVLFWFADSAVDSLIFHERTFIEQLISPTPVEIWIRLLVTTLIIIFGITVRHFNIKLLKEKELHISELHHRIKNNLAVVISMLSQSKFEVSDGSVDDILRNARNRIYSVASIHDELHRIKGLPYIDFSRYITNLSETILETYSTDTTRVRLIVNIPDILLGIEYVLPCGLITNELISNALQHAFEEGKEGEIRIEAFKEPGNKISLVVRDSGSGIPDTIDIQRTSSMGMAIIRGLVQQIKGTIELKRDTGTEFRISFKDKTNIKADPLIFHFALN